MGCLIAIAAVVCPRVVLFVFWIATDYFDRAYDTHIWPLLGFLFMPFTTLAYMWAAIATGHNIAGWWIVLIVVAVIADLSSHGQTARSGGLDLRR